LVGELRTADVRSLKAPDLQRSTCIVLRGVVGTGGLCRVTLEVEGAWEMPEHEEERSYVIGLAGIGFAQSSNAAARADLLEALAFNIVSAPAAKLG
jgi:hypothetical protein